MKKLLIFCSAVVVIQAIFLFFPGQNLFLPSPLEVFNAFIGQAQHGELWIDILMSIKRVIVGFLLAAVAAIPLAILCGYNRRFGNFVKPFVEFLRPIPPIAWIPIAILLFGLGDRSSYFIVFLGAFFPIFTNAYFGAVSLPVVYKNISESFEIRKSTFVSRILFYFALPSICTGLKIGIGMAWMSVIAAELIGAQSGLGYFIQLNRLLLRTDNVVLGMILIGLIGYVLTKSLEVLGEWATPWVSKNKS